MIHILDFNDNIIDFIDREDGALLSANLKRDVEEKTETFDFTILSDRADNLRERNRVITQDHNGIYREFIIVHVEDDYDGTTDVQCNASYLEDLTTSKPLPPQTFEKMTTSQALTKALADTGWEVSDETEYGGVRSKSWTSYNNPYEVVNMLETAYEMVSDYYVELGSHTVEHRYVSLKKPNPLFNGKEITKGKDLTGLTRTVDTSEVRTALIALGPEDDKGNRETVIVKDDEAHAQFGLPGRYLWDVYEPESEDSSMTKERLTTLATTELNKRKQLSVSYEISALDIHRYYDDVRVSLRDIVRVKDRDFNPPLYVEAEVISCEYDMILDDTVFKFGNVVEYEETTLREEFNRRLDEIRKKLNDNISNVNTIVNDAIEGELEYYERKIIKSDTVPDNPVENMLWYDTSNPNVAVLKRYHNGEWRNETAKNVEQLGGMTREQVLYNSLTNTFQNLNIQHSKLLEEVYQLLNSEYLVDTDIRNAVNNAVNNTTNIYDQIKSNLDTMTGDTATIGKLVDTQALFLKYRERLQDLYKAMRNAQVAVEDRLALLQSQYTDEKFNDAMDKIAQSLPNGRWDSENNQLLGDIPSREELAQIQNTIIQYMAREIGSLNEAIGEETDYKINIAKNEISASINSVERKIDGIEVGGRNLFIQDASYYNDEALYGYRKIADTKTKKVITIKEKDDNVDISGIYFGLSVNGKDSSSGYRWEIYNGELLRELDNNNSLENYYYISYFPNKAETLEKLSKRFDIKIENGTVPTTYTLAPEDLQRQMQQAQKDAQEAAQAYADAQDELKETKIKAYADDKITAEEKRAIADAESKLEIAKQDAQTKADAAQEAAQSYALTQARTAKTDAEAAAKAYAKAQDELKQTETKAYADGIVSDEEQRAISDAIAKRDEAKLYADQKAQEAQEAANQNTINQLKPITTRVTSNETNISELDKKISLMAKSEDVAQKLRDVDGRLTPLETDVKNNKATLDILPTQIESKVSKQDYTLDKDNIVQRLNNADSERIQLSNKISDKVSLSELNYGIADAKHYADQKVTSNDYRLSQMETSISQNGREIRQRVSQQDFNASRKTLSQVIAEISATTKGINLSYDENGNIQSYTMDKNGIQLRGDKVDITVNKDFNVMASRVDNKVGKDEIINRLNLSPEGLDIDVNKVGIRGGDGTNYIKIANSGFLSYGNFKRSWAGVEDTAKLELGISNGRVLIRNQNTGYRLYLTERGLSTMMDGFSEDTSGTLEFHSTRFNDTSRGITMHSTYGAVAMLSEQSRAIVRSNLTANIESYSYGVYIRPYVNTRPGINEFNFYVKSNDNAGDTDGAILFGEVSDDKGLAGSGIRFKKKGLRGETSGDYEPMVYATDNTGSAGTGSFYARKFYGDFQSRSGYLYLMANDRVRITDYKGYNNGNPNYADLQCQHIQSNTIRTNTGKDFYIGVSSNELRVTNNLFWNGGNTGYKPVRASDYLPGSLERFKKDIIQWDGDALNEIANNMTTYEYRLKDDEDDRKKRKGLVIGEGYKTPEDFIDGDGVSVYNMITYSLRAIQQLNEKIEKLEGQLNG
ncbi:MULTISPECIES: phage tail spike protein [unclassified Staphylococcus]|uniref:phage tail spike protein n=1 Tax=unclassified Staphylococcus TaxID=91994 RepID=UPI00122DDF27|nr:MULTISPECIES: phage tail spike protein [unclassified Staphylococcus]KAA2278108.1 hypothetical protein F1592_00890 [Staphylococcus sp. GDX7P312P]KAA2281455.1 hypothetical protein F1591_03115 [Staphylococcus sp. GDX7P459A]